MFKEIPFDAVLFIMGFIIGLIIIGPVISFLLFNWYPVYKDHKLAKRNAHPLTEQFLNKLKYSDLALYGTCNWGFLQEVYENRLKGG